MCQQLLGVLLAHVPTPCGHAVGTCQHLRSSGVGPKCANTVPTLAQRPCTVLSRIFETTSEYGAFRFCRPAAAVAARLRSTSVHC